MSKKMGIEGVGPKIVIPVLIGLMLIFFINRSNPELFVYTNNKQVLIPIYLVLLGIGVLFWIGSAIQLLFSWRKKKLITTGFYAVFLNPLYVAWIFFILPAISLYLNSWIYLFLSVIFYLAMRCFIGGEDAYLRSTFGQDYENYRKRVWLKI